MKTYEVKMGRGVQRWQSPYDYIVPQPRGRGLCGASCSVEEALDRPIASPSLEELAKDSRRIAIVVPDVTRGWCRAPEMSAAVRKRLAVNKTAEVTWIVATGQHRAVEERDKELVFGGAMMSGDRWLSHDCEDVVDTGLVTPLGTPVTLDPAFVAADLAVLVGGITFHDMAGFSGGRKMIMPGVSGRVSIVKNHNHCLKDGGLNPATDSGLLERNPMAQDQRAYADLALRGKKCFILNTIADGAGQPAAWVAGDVWKAWETGCETCRSFASLWIPRKAARAVSSCGGFPLDLDLYQATKALFSPLSALEPGAPIVLVADLEDSLGPGDFEASLRSSLHDAPAFVRRMETAFTIPGYIALRAVLELRGRPAALVTSRENVPFPGQVFRDMQSAEMWLQEQSGTGGPSILIPSGNSVHVFAAE